MKILVIEKSGNASHYMIEYFKIRGHEVFSAFNLYDAESHLGKIKPDMIILGDAQNDGFFSKNDVAGIKPGFVRYWISWKWYKKKGFHQNPEMIKRTIFLTHGIEIMERSKLSGARIVKPGKSGPARIVLQHLKEIEELPRLSQQ